MPHNYHISPYNDNAGTHNISSAHNYPGAGGDDAGQCQAEP